MKKSNNKSRLIPLLVLVLVALVCSNVLTSWGQPRLADPVLPVAPTPTAAFFQSSGLEQALGGAAVGIGGGLLAFAFVVGGILIFIAVMRVILKKD